MMFRLIFSVTTLLLGVALLLTGTGLLNTLLALRATMEGYSDRLIGVIMSSYFIGFFLGTFTGLPLIKRIGHIRTFAFSAALISVSVLLHLLFLHPAVWIVLRILTGASLVTLYAVIESWLNGQTPAQHRGKVFAVYVTVNLSALAMAQQLLRLGTPDSFLLFTLASIFVTLSLVPVTWTRLQQPEVSEVNRLKIRKLWQTAPVAVMGALLSGLAMGGFWGMGATYAGRIGLDNTGIATFMSAVILGGALFQYPLGRCSDSFDRRKVLFIVCFIASVVAVIFAMSTGYLLALLLLVAVYGGLAFAIYPISVAHMIDHLESKDILGGGSGLLFLHGVGAACGPALAGQLMSLLGPKALPGFFTITLFTLGLFAWRHTRVLIDDHIEMPTHFVPMVRTTPTALNMLPDENEPNSTEPEDAGFKQTDKETV